MMNYETFEKLIKALRQQWDINLNIQKALGGCEASNLWILFDSVTSFLNESFAHVFDDTVFNWIYNKKKPIIDIWNRIQKLYKKYLKKMEEDYGNKK